MYISVSSVSYFSYRYPLELTGQVTLLATKIIVGAVVYIISLCIFD